jgi:hypothetical protein
LSKLKDEVRQYAAEHVVGIAAGVDAECWKA